MILKSIFVLAVYIVVLGGITLILTYIMDKYTREKNND